MITKRHIKLLLLLAAGLLVACSPDEPPQPEAQDEICLNAEVQKVMQKAPCRATTYDNATALQTEAQFTCAAYEANTLTAYIPTTTVDWNSTAWEFNHGDSHYYWPLPPTNGGSYPSLDFFAYMPATAPTYINSITYTSAHNVTFGCSSLPMTNAGQDDLKEFIYGMALGQNKGNASSGVPLQFRHPFAKIVLQLSPSQADIHIDRITFKSIKNNGSYSHDAGWTPSGDATNLVLTLDHDYSHDDLIGTYIMIPQNWAGEIEVVATWTDWGEALPHTLTATKPTTWATGTSYTYTFTIKETDLIVDTSKFTEQW